MISSKRLAIFDFCGTLANFQTADAFVNFTARKYEKNAFVSRFLSVLRRIAYRARLISSEENKRSVLRQLAGLSQTQIDGAAQDFFETQVLPNLYPAVMRKLTDHRSRGDVTVILSGGYRPYLEVFARRFGVDHVIATELEFVDGVCTGKLSGVDCMSKEKITRLEAVIPLSEFNLAEACFYTDHPSDLPVLELVGRGYIVAPESVGRPEWARAGHLGVIHV